MVLIKMHVTEFFRTIKTLHLSTTVFVCVSVILKCKVKRNSTTLSGREKSSGWKLKTYYYNEPQLYIYYIDILHTTTNK